jgi:glucose-1-phosphate thymidylyltransferase
MKALILSGGKGTRLRPLTYTTAKQLVPVANKPILGYVLDHIRDAGITNVGVIISPESGEEVKRYIDNGRKWGIRVTFIPQDAPLGLAHAVSTARDFLKHDDFIMYLGDNLLSHGVKRAIKKFRAEGPKALIFLKEVDDPRQFGVAKLDRKGNIIQLIEKPKEPPSNLALVGVYIFAKEIHEAITRITPSFRGELEITDAIQELIHMGYRVRSEVLEGWWLDTGKKDDLLQANTVVLDEYIKKDIQGSLDDTTRITGRVTVEKGAVIRESMIRGPVIVGKDTEITNSFIGPFTSIGEGVTIRNSVVEHSVILNRAFLSGIERLEDSLIGKNTKVIRKDTMHKALRLMVGDDSTVEV